MEIRESYNLKESNTFGIKATAQYYAEYANVSELRQVLAWRKENCPYAPLLPIGEGSNLLFTTPTYRGLVIKAAKQSAENVMIADGGRVTVWGGVKMDEFIAWSIRHNLYGLENLSHIPGTVGASAVQNIGAYGTEVSQYIDSVRAIDVETLKERTFDKEECAYAYRDSHFKHHRHWIVTSVTYMLSPTFTPNLKYGNIASLIANQEPTAQEVREAVIAARESKLPDPKVQGNAGSFFMNPIVGIQEYNSLASEYGFVPHYPAPGSGQTKLSAAWLIEQAGWKGRALGNAAVSEKHSLILVNTGRAKGRDVVMLCKAIQNDVRNQFGIDLIPEVNFL